MEEVRNIFKILVGKSGERTLFPRVVDKRLIFKPVGSVVEWSEHGTES
jgi:hypothetical protein